jgi:signal transduction histidine kinase
MAKQVRDDTDRGPDANLAFSVDTHLLRELGALLVGRDSTALVELIKNAYDADATTVTIYGQQLSSHGHISIRDNGHGMTYADFRDKFLRIAGRSKEGGTRRSPVFGRKYTGAKGIGRLSAHKLGEGLALESTPNLSVLNRTASEVGFTAKINWTAIEASTASMDQAKEIEVRRSTKQPDASTQGTLLTINRLHSEWSSQMLNRFLAEVRSTRADPALTTPLPPDVFVGDALVPSVVTSDSAAEDAGFKIELTGDFAGSEAQWPTLLAHVSWILEIDALSDSEVVYRIAPARHVQAQFPDVESRTFSWARTSPGPRFVARIFIRDGLARSSSLPDTLSTFANEASGVRLFFEGFRVLPYGAPRNDWLGLATAATRRTALDYLDEIDLEALTTAEVNEKTYQLANTNYFGAVFLLDEGSAGLQMVVNREGFLPGEDFEQLTEIVRRGINISVRVRAAIGAQERLRTHTEAAQERESLISDILDDAERVQTRGIGDAPSTSQARLATWLQVGEQAAKSIRLSGPSVVVDPAMSRNMAVVSAVMEEVRSVSSEAAREQSQLRVLASLGTQLGAFVHEINGILGQGRAVRTLLDRLIDDSSTSVGTRARLRDARRAQNEVVASLERQAVYLSDSLGAEARRRRARQSVHERWITATGLLGGAASRRDVALVNLLPSSLRTPPMFPSEMNVILTNLLSNAIKAAATPSSSDSTNSPDKEVRISGEKSNDQLRVRIENTGVAVDLGTAERWFRPFETTTSDVDVALGQGLGLGLSLTRRIVEEYGGGILFVPPRDDMATAIEFWLPDR